ncbi:FecR family protein [Pedobacter sp. MR2016-24]|uniref:FecR family protein n=1 Tax=Pedobacter sp. MR2016-24 TaxID=2994466 RepID=UPI002246D2DD|nr:FecR family protein [Pedobacter sp. MR2016-24]MCX2485490.1 FecR family protein [Pedobacter sp. MR2016-24]
MEEDYLKKLVNRYLDKKSTDEELEVFTYLMKQGKLDKYFEEAMGNDISGYLQTGIPHNGNELNKKRNTHWITRWSIAALITFGLSLFAYNALHKQTVNTIAKSPLIKVHNMTHSITRQLLPDGSIVWLSPEARLTFPSRFGKLRQVTMEGEAFFEVTKDAEHPFIVTSGKVKTKVWGTSFRIRSIPGEDYTKVSVLTGKVSVSIPLKPNIHATKRVDETEVILHPEEEANYQHTNHQLLKAVVPPASDLRIWHKASLTFENTKVEDIVAELSKYYHLDVQAEGIALRQYQLTADFTNKNLADILVLICKSVHAEYSKENNKIILRTLNQQPKTN